MDRKYDRMGISSHLRTAGSVTQGYSMGGWFGVFLSCFLCIHSFITRGDGWVVWGGGEVEVERWGIGNGNKNGNG